MAEGQQPQGMEELRRAIELIVSMSPEARDALFTKAAVNNVLPPDIPGASPNPADIAQGITAQVPQSNPSTSTLPVAGSQPAAAPTGPDPQIANFLQALQGVQAPPSPQVQPPLGAPGVPRGQIPQGSEELLLRLFASAQQSAPQGNLGGLILGL